MTEAFAAIPGQSTCQLAPCVSPWPGVEFLASSCPSIVNISGPIMASKCSLHCRSADREQDRDGSRGPATLEGVATFSSDQSGLPFTGQQGQEGVASSKSVCGSVKCHQHLGAAREGKEAGGGAGSKHTPPTHHMHTPLHKHNIPTTHLHRHTHHTNTYI